MLTTFMTRAIALGAVMVLGATGCAARYRSGTGYAYGPSYVQTSGYAQSPGYVQSPAYAQTPYDPNQCQWVWVDDGFGGYQQLSCWNNQYSTYQPYVSGGAYARVYPRWYRGARARVVMPPSVFPAPPVYAAPPTAYGHRMGPSTYAAPSGAYGGSTVYAAPATPTYPTPTYAAPPQGVGLAVGAGVGAGVPPTYSNPTPAQGVPPTYSSPRVGVPSTGAPPLAVGTPVR